MQRIITLTTDFGYKDYYVGALKGKIYSNIQDCNIVDISHDVTNYNIEEAGFIIASAYSNFPKGTIHIIAVDSSVNELNPAICVKYDNHYFITSDNGILTYLLAGEGLQEAIYVHYDGSMRSNDLFVYCAYQLFEGRKLKNMGTKATQLVKLNRLGDALSIEENRITGKVIYEDSYGNLITNVTREVFESTRATRNFVILVKNYRVTRINRFFADFKTTDSLSLKDRAGDFIAVFNDLDLLVLTLLYSKPNNPGGTPRTLMNIQVNDNINIEFDVLVE